MGYQITDADIEAFTEGDCWALAQEISRRTGWPAFALGVYREYTEQGIIKREDELDWVHFVVLTPEGYYLDVNGSGTGQDMNDHYIRALEQYRAYQADLLEFVEVKGKNSWSALVRHQGRLFPAAPVAKVAAAVIRDYHADRLTNQQRTFGPVLGNNTLRDQLADVFA